ncbi:hypothetical protein KDW_46280 [Dictyobacter vulcani]|uniref:AAA+ ATPase domain-containing protein n=1 Tax=Dictyobacter vulcani TaxID=2607529 RepID=A0A5J4KZ50_9CHLR|nr:ATP-binding protein [Dictyobacter vulcani]GER90466.1 hypothetical protein KDW_46280 [Dictyobacter vulcani]
MEHIVNIIRAHQNSREFLAMQQPDNDPRRWMTSEEPADEDAHGGEAPMAEPEPGTEFERSSANYGRPMAKSAFELPSAQTSIVKEPAEPSCTRCSGRRYFRMEVEISHPLFGKAVACTCMQAIKEEHHRQYLRQLSNLDTLEEFRYKSLNTFNGFLPGTRQAFQQAASYACNPEGWLIFIGPNGCGKTHLAVAIARHRLEARDTVLFAVVPDLLDYLRATYAPKAEIQYDILFQRMRQAQFLVLDDLGTEQHSPWANEKLFQLLNHRYNAHLATVITTNLIGLEGIEPRLRSRMSDTRLVQRIDMIDAPDYRLHPNNV